MNTPTADVPRRSRFWRWILGLAVVGLAAWVAFLRPHEVPSATHEAAPRPSLAAGPSQALMVPEETIQAMKLTSESAQPANQTRPLQLTGQLMIDPGRLVHINARFPGEVVQVGSRKAKEQPYEPLRPGDRVQKGQRLAVVWSKEIGEKKSDLVDALSQLGFHEKLYLSLKTLQKDGGVSQRVAEEAKRNYESDLIQVERLRRTLRSWRLDEQELVEVESEARRIQERAGDGPGEGSPRDDSRLSASWAEIDIRSPLNGVILEKNITVGDLVSTEADLFQVADLSQLIVMANVYEEDLHRLTALPADEREWSFTLPAMPKVAPRTGKIDFIGNVIDANQHTAIAQGWVDNSAGDLRVGQFVEVTVEVALPQDLVEIPAGALIDDGPRKFVLIAADESLSRVTRREVRVIHRTSKSIYLRATRDMGVEVGERVLTSGVVELLSVLNDLAPAPPEVAQAPSSGTH